MIIDKVNIWMNDKDYSTLKRIISSHTLPVCQTQVILDIVVSRWNEPKKSQPILFSRMTKKVVKTGSYATLLVLIRNIVNIIA